MKIACLTVIYPGVEEYLDDFLRSWRAQTLHGSDLIVVNDGFKGCVQGSLSSLDIEARVIECRKSPAENRLRGLESCQEHGYDIVVCADADETMDPTRIEKVANFLSEHPEKDVVFNNAVARAGQSFFDLHYKRLLRLEDIVDFNVLGYGAMNLRRSLIPFVLQHRNPRAEPFDWWLALVLLLRRESVDFLPDAKNLYRAHPGNLLGPLFEPDANGVLRALRMKRGIYREMAEYVCRNGMGEREKLFRNKLDEIREVEEFIRHHSMETYLEQVRCYAQAVGKLFWLEEVVPLKTLLGESNEDGYERRMDLGALRPAVDCG